MSLQANHLLYRDFPIGISRPYKELTLAPDWGTRHMGLLGFAEASIVYMASLCISDYRTRAREPAHSLEVMLEQSRSKKLTLGRELALFRASASGIEAPLIPAPVDFPDVGHTGTVCGLLFANTDAGRTAASEASLEVSRQFSDLKDVMVVTTPYCKAVGHSNAGLV